MGMKLAQKKKHVDNILAGEITFLRNIGNIQV
jgi:hypothetical protein